MAFYAKKSGLVNSFFKIPKNMFQNGLFEILVGKKRQIFIIPLYISQVIHRNSHLSTTSLPGACLGLPKKAKNGGSCRVKRKLSTGCPQCVDNRPARKTCPFCSRFCYNFDRRFHHELKNRFFICAGFFSFCLCLLTKAGRGNPASRQAGPCY